MEFTPLSAEQRQQFDERGFLVVRQVLSQEMVQRLIAAGDKLVASVALRISHISIAVFDARCV